jgi:hypothetical protein
MAAMHARLRWYTWPIAALLLLLTVVIIVRLHGLNRFRETQDELRRLGFATTMEELVAAGPSVDRDRQERCRRLMVGPGPKWMEDVSTALPSNDLQEQRFPAKDLAKRDQALRDGATDVATMEAIFAEGPVELSLYGWCERDPAKLRVIDLPTASATLLPSLLATRGFANWWANRACLDGDPEPHLRQLDRLIASMDHPGTLIDAMIGFACSSIRDRAHLWLATRGRLGEARLGTWAGEKSPQRAWCAAGYAGERCVLQEPLSRTRWNFGVWFGASGGFLDEVWMLLRVWPTQGHEAAYCCSYLAQAEAALLDKPQPTLRAMPFGYHGMLSAITMPNLVECIVTATEAANGHRLARCAALVAASYRRGGALPATLPAEAPAAAIDANLPALLYERLSPSRMRIGIDPSGPLPPAIPADRWAGKGYASEIGRPAGTRSVTMSYNLRWSVELDLDAILLPPPERPAKAKKP